MIVLAIDPGPAESAWCRYDAETKLPIDYAKVANVGLRNGLAGFSKHSFWGDRFDELAIEMLACYGMPFGTHLIETALWIGRFAEAAGCDWTRVYRQDVKRHLCGGRMSARDSNVNQALKDRHGGDRRIAVGTKKQPGPLYGMTGDMWAAYAVAVTYAEVHHMRKAA